MHIHHNICTVHWLETRSPPKVIHQPNVKFPLWQSKEILYGIGLPCGASPTYSLDDTTVGCVKWWHASSPAGPQQALYQPTYCNNFPCHPGQRKLWMYIIIYSTSSTCIIILCHACAHYWTGVSCGIILLSWWGCYSSVGVTWPRDVCKVWSILLSTRLALCYTSIPTTVSRWQHSNDSTFNNSIPMQVSWTT